MLLVIRALVLRPTWSKPLNDEKHVRDQEKKLNYFIEVENGCSEISAKSFEVKIICPVAGFGSRHMELHACGQSFTKSGPCNQVRCSICKAAYLSFRFNFIFQESAIRTSFREGQANFSYNSARGSCGASLEAIRAFNHECSCIPISTEKNFFG